MAAIESLINGSEKITDIFGHWPSFHDAEVIDLHFWRGNVDPDNNSYVFPVLTVKVYVYEPTGEVEPDGGLVMHNHTLTTLRFHNVEEDFNMGGFNHINDIFGLSIAQCKRSDGPSPYFDVQFSRSSPDFGLVASFKCSRIEVIDAVAGREHGEPYP